MPCIQPDESGGHRNFNVCAHDFHITNLTLRNDFESWTGRGNAVPVALYTDGDKRRNAPWIRISAPKARFYEYCNTGRGAAP